MVEIATVMFVAVEVPLQYETTQLLSIVNGAGAGLTTEIPVFHSDGTALARVRGALLFLTKEGEKTGLNLRFPQGMAVCELEGRTLLAHCRAGAAALQASAEL